MIGRRRDDANVTDLERGDYALRIREDGRREVWFRMPNDDIAHVSDRWEITEEDDGTITVHPSILAEAPGQPDRTWHGWLTRGVWTEA